MNWISGRTGVALGITIAALYFAWPSAAWAAGVLYSDPGWFYAYEGDEAFYDDPDGPNPDYINGDDSNAPGGQGGSAALDMAWKIQSSNWDGSAPGDPLGGTPGDPPPIPPAAPGGVGTFNDNGTSFLRIQDAGQPQNWGWPDKGEQAGEGTPRQEGNNRKIQFAHEMNQDAMFSEDQAVIDNGITLSFRTRLATAATGPIDAIHVEGGASASPGRAPVPWPADGLGYEVSNEGRGMFHLTQTTALGFQQQMAFGLIDQDTITFEGLAISKTGLVMPNQANPAAGNDIDTNEANDNTVNIVEIDDGDLDEWQEFWITIEAISLSGAGEALEDANGNTHEANVYHNGSLEPETFQFRLGPENEFGNGAHLGLGLSSGSRQGAYDIDFYAYREGVMAPTLAGIAGDYNGDGVVDAADHTLWQDLFGSTTDLRADGDGSGMVDPNDNVVWRNNFGLAASANGSGLAVSAAVPEPTSAFAGLIAALAGALISRRAMRSN